MTLYLLYGVTSNIEQINTKLRKPETSDNMSAIC